MPICPAIAAIIAGIAAGTCGPTALVVHGFRRKPAANFPIIKQKEGSDSNKIGCSSQSEDCFARGNEELADLLGHRNQLTIYDFMLGPGWSEGCSDPPQNQTWKRLLTEQPFDSQWWARRGLNPQPPA